MKRSSVKSSKNSLFGMVWKKKKAACGGTPNPPFSAQNTKILPVLKKRWVSHKLTKSNAPFLTDDIHNNNFFFFLKSWARAISKNLSLSLIFGK